MDVDEFFVDANVIDESTYIPPPPFAITTTFVLIVTTHILTRTHVETPMAFVFTPLNSMATPVAPAFTMATNVVIANPPLQVSTTLNVQDINIVSTHSIHIHGGQKIEEVAHAFTMPSPTGVIRSLPLTTSKALDVGMNMNNNDVNGCTSIELAFGVRNEVIHVPLVNVSQKNGWVFRHISSTLLSRARGGGQPKKKRCHV